LECYKAAEKGRKNAFRAPNSGGGEGCKACAAQANNLRETLNSTIIQNK